MRTDRTLERFETPVIPGEMRKTKNWLYPESSPHKIIKKEPDADE